MAIRRTSIPESEPLFRCNAPKGSMWRYGHSLVSLLLLFTFLHSLLLLVPPAPQADSSSSNQVVLSPAHDAQTLADYPLDSCPVPLENAPDEEGDSNETAEPDKDFLSDETSLPYFSRLLLKQMGYGEHTPGCFYSPLPGVSPPPERVA